ncbi:MAG: hypothetical protein JSV23_11115 [Promethearchaeota archaeon]|nr:MAG: hypothetical protein JSV23_11115 [Candidatus Lokiarchaeota archaeon]
MTASKEKIIPFLKEFPKYEILDKIEKELKKEVKVVTTVERVFDPIQKRRDEVSWKQTMGNYLLHPEKFKFGLRDLK